MLDAGSSAAHTRSFLDGLREQGIAPPSLVVLTHSHWDHVFGAAELGAPVVAHVRTAEYLRQLAELDWSDEALDQRLAAGEVSSQHVEHVREELPAPREVRVAPADVVFADSLSFELGGVTVRALHVENDHTDDGVVLFVEPDRVLFLGDAIYDSPAGALTTRLALPLVDTLLGFGAEQVVQGHDDTVTAISAFEQLTRKIRRVGALLGTVGADEAAILSALGEPADEDTRDVVRAFVSGAAA